MKVHLSEISARVLSGGIAGPPILQGSTSITVVLTRLLRDASALNGAAWPKAPDYTVLTVVEGAIASLRDKDLLTISSILTENFSEPLRLPEGTYVLGDARDDATADTGSGWQGARTSVSLERGARAQSSPPPASGVFLSASVELRAAELRLLSSLKGSDVSGSSGVRSTPGSRPSTRGLSVREGAPGTPSNLRRPFLAAGPPAWAVSGGGNWSASSAGLAGTPDAERGAAARVIPLVAVQIVGASMSAQMRADGAVQASASVPTLRLSDTRPGVPEHRREIVSAGRSHAAIRGAPAPPEADSGSSTSETVSLAPLGSPARTSASEVAAVAPFLSISLSAAAAGGPVQADMRLHMPTLFAEASLLVALADFFLPFAGLRTAPPKGAPPSMDVVLRPGRNAVLSDIHLSPAARLCTDPWAEPGTEFALHANGRRIYLPETVLGVGARVPLVVVHPGHVLRLEDVTLVNACNFPASLWLCPGARVVADPADGVVMDIEPRAFGEEDLRAALEGSVDVHSAIGLLDVVPGDLLVPSAVAGLLHTGILTPDAVRAAQVALVAAGGRGEALEESGRDVEAAGGSDASREMRVALEVVRGTVGVSLDVAIGDAGGKAASAVESIAEWQLDLRARARVGGGTSEVLASVTGLEGDLETAIPVGNGGGSRGGSGRERSVKERKPCAPGRLECLRQRSKILEVCAGSAGACIFLFSDVFA